MGPAASAWGPRFDGDALHLSSGLVSARPRAACCSADGPRGRQPAHALATPDVTTRGGRGRLLGGSELGNAGGAIQKLPELRIYLPCSDRGSRGIPRERREAATAYESEGLGCTRCPWGNAGRTASERALRRAWAAARASHPAPGTGHGHRTQEAAKSPAMNWGDYPLPRGLAGRLEAPRPKALPPGWGERSRLATTTRGGMPSLLPASLVVMNSPHESTRFARPAMWCQLKPRGRSRVNYSPCTSRGPGAGQ